MSSQTGRTKGYGLKDMEIKIGVTQRPFTTLENRKKKSSHLSYNAPYLREMASTRPLSRERTTLSTSKNPNPPLASHNNYCSQPMNLQTQPDLLSH
jgi:hypothetical protein